MLIRPQGSRSKRSACTLPCCTDQVWHGYVSGVRPGQLYGYRVHGPYEPGSGHRFNRGISCLLDPYARQVAGQHPLARCAQRLPFSARHRGRSDARPSRQRAAYMPKGVVEDPAQTWGDDRKRLKSPGATRSSTRHIVKGLTELHPDMAGAGARHLYCARPPCGGRPPRQDRRDERSSCCPSRPSPMIAFPRTRSSCVNYWGYSTLELFLTGAALLTVSDGAYRP